MNPPLVRRVALVLDRPKGRETGMALGDQIYVMRPLVGVAGVYEHHGIDCGDGTVIHFHKGEQGAEVKRTSREAFAQGSAIYGQRVTTAFLPSLVVARAESRLGDRDYDLLTRNCEHFATWCKTGRWESAQVARFGLHLDRLPLATLQAMVGQAQRDRAPQDAQALFHDALGNIQQAHATLKAQYQKAQQEQGSWHRVAQVALGRDREDLARAALQRKAQAQKQLTALTQQLGTTARELALVTKHLFREELKIDDMTQQQAEACSDYLRKENS